MDTRGKFQGDKKLPLKSPLASVERKFIDFWVPRFPPKIEGYHLTLTTILWSAGLIVCGYLARQDIRWLWAASGMLFMQWFTDSFDGALGRYRDTGIPKWGFYMDHLLDYIFGTGIVEKALPFVPFLAVLVLVVVVYRTQKYIWRIDMEDKQRRQK